jgi:GMP synthase (glutamine-hydrolysing)
MKPILVVQNDLHEGAGQLTTLMAERGLEQHTAFGFDADYVTLESDEFAALVLLGGAQSAYETDMYPYLSKEMELCRAFIGASKPIAGFCLGAQILACAVGGEVVPGNRKEIGWYDLILTNQTENDSLMQGHPKKLRSYHFHGDVIATVPNATRLAYSAITEFQLFRCGSNAYGFQYHAEADRPLIEIMCRNNSDYMASNGFDAETIIEESSIHLPEFERRCRVMLDRWLDLV